MRSDLVRHFASSGIARITSPARLRRKFQLMRELPQLLNLRNCYARRMLVANTRLNCAPTAHDGDAAQGKGECGQCRDWVDLGALAAPEITVMEPDVVVSAIIDIGIKQEPLLNPECAGPPFK